ncbi:CDP-alcohol phosphatidyltransferase family protein [soil metagenome]
MTGTRDTDASLIEQAGHDRILTIPNVISLIRLGCMPVFVYLLFGRDNAAAAAWLLAALGTTDWIDGYIARHFDQVSALGKVLDPVADRLLFFVGVGAILINGSVPVALAVAVLVREAVVAAATLVLAAMGAKRIDVTWFGKAGTFGLMVAFPLFLAADSTLGWRDTAEVLAWIAAVPGLAFSYWSMIMYVPLGRQALRDGRAEAAPAA